MAASANNPLIAKQNAEAAARAANNLGAIVRSTPATPEVTPAAAVAASGTTGTMPVDPETAKKQNVTAEVGTSISTKTKRLYNPLSKYSSTTYRISLYMITPETVNAYSETGFWDLKSMIMIAQSGGVTDGVDAPRSPFFPLDLYIDNLSITSVIDAKEAGVSTTSFEFKFQIFEPYGISFTNNLHNAAIHMQTMSNIQRNLSQPINALNVQYMLAIHFYGYDKDGKITTSSAVDASASSGVSSGAAFQRLFPIQFVRFSTKLDNKNATYDITANMFNHQVAFSKTRGAVPDATTISAGTVKEALDHLASSMNKKQKLLSGSDKKYTQEIADEYEFVFEDEDIAEATLVDKNHFVVNNTPMPQVLSTMNINVRLSESGKADIVNKQQRQIQLVVGTPFMQVIDQVITQSSYLRNVLKTIDKEELSKTKDVDKGFVENNNPKPLYWYHVTPKISITGWDKKRQQYAFKITYVIKKKEVPYIRSAAVSKTTQYPGAYKQYDFWYTGKNSEILSYEQIYNLGYFNPDARSSEAASTHVDSSAPTVKTAASGSASTGGQPGTNAAADNIRTYMYSPGDQVNAKIQILGDPDFIMTSEAGSTANDSNKVYGDDYTINPASGQVFIEIGFNQVHDYDTNIGVLQPDNNIYFWNYSEEIKKAAGNRMIYNVIIVKSRFSKGKFTQELVTSLPPFSEETGTNESKDQRAESKKSYNVAFDKGNSSDSWDNNPIPQKPQPKTYSTISPVSIEDDNVKPVIVKKQSINLTNGGREPVQSVIRIKP